MGRYANIIEGFRLALLRERPSGAFSPLCEISSLLLGENVPALSLSGKRIGTFIAEMERFSSATFVPVVEFPVGADKVDSSSAIISSVENTIIRQAALESNVATGVKYMIEECSDNILEHSRSECGYIASSYDMDKDLLDICIADRGITVLGSYRSVNDPDISSDLEALQAANRGISTKNRPNAENRGYGLMTTKKMAVQGLGGAFAMISGGTIFISDSNGRRFIDTSNQVKISGTIISLRIACKNPEFNYIKYID